MLGASAAATEVSMNSTIAAAKIRRCPRASDMLPISGMAATYPSR